MFLEENFKEFFAKPSIFRLWFLELLQIYDVGQSIRDPFFNIFVPHSPKVDKNAPKIFLFNFTMVIFNITIFTLIFLKIFGLKDIISKIIFGSMGFIFGINESFFWTLLWLLIRGSDKLFENLIRMFLLAKITEIFFLIILIISSSKYAFLVILLPSFLTVVFNLYLRKLKGNQTFNFIIRELLNEMDIEKGQISNMARFIEEEKKENNSHDLI